MGYIIQTTCCELYHHGIKGQKWGVRRYQNADGSLTNVGKRKYLNKMSKDMNQHFKSQLSKEAAKVSNIGDNGHDVRGSRWNDAYRKGKVTKKDDAQIKKAAKNTREYALDKYGKEAVQALAERGVLSLKLKDFKVNDTSILNAKNYVETIVSTKKQEPKIPGYVPKKIPNPAEWAKKHGAIIN